MGDKRYATVYIVRNDEGPQVPGLWQDVRGTAQDGTVLLERLPAAGFPYQEGQEMTGHKVQHFEVLFIGSEISSDDLSIALTNGLSDLQAQGGLPPDEEWQLEVVPMAVEDAHLG